MIGDQCAALVGQKCFGIGMAKVTYGTGCFLIQNLGPGPMHGALKGVSKEAKQKLVTTVAYKLGTRPACYALEGSVAIAGAAVTWLRDNLELIHSYSEIERIANEDKTAGGLFFVPAFQGICPFNLTTSNRHLIHHRSVRPVLGRQRHRNHNWNLAVQP